MAAHHHFTGAQATVLILIVGAVLINQNPSQAQAFNQKATLFSGHHCKGDKLDIAVTQWPNLQTQNFDNKACSALVNGAWLFYDQPNFNAGPSATMRYVFQPNNNCIEFGHLDRRISSARFAGWSKDFKANTLTFYQKDFFQGASEYTHADLPKLTLLDKNVASLIVTGLSPWTFYALPNYTGEAICIYPPPQPNFTPAFITSTTKIEIPVNSIRSARLGCFGRVVSIGPVVTSGNNL